ncbi:MAG: hypothetical protein LRZ97_02015 [Candidatus Pacebacteria bacterium]|nr:hypothetical protein [Candidatus Paceibacterota bacterium]
MNLEELNKSQIVLLTLLISFVTSMATGIVAVSLMEQGASPVTNTVNRIVERTKEIIVRVEESTPPIIITEEKTVLIREEDLVASAIAKNKDVSVAVYKTVTVEVNTEVTAEDTKSEGETLTTVTPPDSQTASALVVLDDNFTDPTEGTTTETQLVFVARGVVLGNGLVATDKSMLDENVTEYTIITNSNKQIIATVSSKSGDIALLSADVRGAVEMVDTDMLEHGQVVIILSGTGRMRVVKTIVAEILTTEGGVDAVDTNASNISPGSILISLDGKLVGISTGTSRINGKSWFTTANKIEKVLPSTDSTDS